MEFIRIKCKGCLNSFRQPDFHTYHKTLPLPPKTTVAGMLGSALGISPKEINDEWLKKERFKMGIVGKSNGTANDLWQIRKYETKQIAAYNKGIEAAPYKTAVIVRELLYASDFIIYLSFLNTMDKETVLEKLFNPEWALSLGREDELIRIIEIKELALEHHNNLTFVNTILPFDINESKYTIPEIQYTGTNLLNDAPKIVKLPVSFSYKLNSDTRDADTFNMFTFVGGMGIKPNINNGYHDEEENCIFKIF